MLTLIHNYYKAPCYDHMLLEEAWGCRQGAVAIGWSELRVTRDHVMDRGGPSGSDGPSWSTSLYKQSSFLATWAARSTQYSTLHLLVTLSNTSQCYLSIVYTGTPTHPRDYRSPTVSRDIGSLHTSLFLFAPPLASLAKRDLRALEEASCFVIKALRSQRGSLGLSKGTALTFSDLAHFSRLP
jgi:hypothetical protein